MFFRHFSSLLIGLSFASASLPAFAYEAGDWLIRGRVITVQPQDHSGTLHINDADTHLAGVKVDNDTVPELDITYMLTRHWGLELILGFSEHTVTGEKNWQALGDVIDSKVLPPTLTFQYHFRPDAAIRPYVGAGINYTYFFDSKVPNASPLAQSGDEVSLDSSWGLAVQAGMDVALGADWFVNLDVKYLDIDTTAYFKNTSVGRAKINAEIDPLVWGVGIGRRF
ncbi:OmpW family protein [Methylophaga frappieri]|uniref:OmpW family protein n=1 Tax=Methylophaga frappieri (strain ATCC BAA-2434 / DSM 25690 / JAM7) TaxID=754477 RepID=I1YJN5_METFJ|nr:OmpW family outer membrane protein [Methylophaga frappieri]AFJ03128.1 OmpW family protein [Methylophaga frappieri]